MNAAGPISANEPGGCLNCGAPLHGAYCSACGQKARVHRSLASFSSDLVAGLFNLEGKFWTTLPMLAWQPGELTRRYVGGQRARFISPVALYLFSVFLMFAALSFSGAAPNVTIRADLEAAVASERLAIERLHRSRDQALRTGQAATVAAVDRQIAGRRTELEQLEKVRAAGFASRLDEDADIPQWLRDAVRRVEADPQRAMARVQEAASKYSWALIPLSVPFVWLLFPLRRLHLYDHAVFVTYSLSFHMLLIIAGSLLVLAGAGSWVPWLLLIPPLHMYRQIKGAYRLGRWGALLRTLLLLIASFVVLTLFAATVIALGLLE